MGRTRGPKDPPALQHCVSIPAAVLRGTAERRDFTEIALERDLFFGLDSLFRIGSDLFKRKLQGS